EAGTGVDSGDFALAATGLSGAAITSVSGSGTTYTVTASTGSGSGSIGLNLVDVDSIVDSAGNKLGGARTGNGTSTVQVYTTVSKATAPGSPTNVQATAADASASLTWSVPASNGGCAITGYVVTQSTDGTNYTSASATVTGTTANVTGLVNGTTYTFKVASVNA